MSTEVSITTLSNIARSAGRAVMEVYDGEDISVTNKDDDSPLTRADTASHAVIVRELGKAYPDIPIISEEGKDVPPQVRQEWPIFFLVDPLDGTKEFIRRNGEFTVNIALVKDHLPIAGVVFAPVIDLLYGGTEGGDAFREEKGERESIPRKTPGGRGRVAVRSRSHANPDEEEILSRYNVVDTVSMGSSLKFCLVADGTADIYVRSGPTYEWDTAAAHAVVRAAGGRVVAGGEELSYNKETLLNPGFICLGRGVDFVGPG
ncbi:MAG: 3'(2'),5'-bisphosphate nucleotidase CysQ [Deltaproteobacteria bacterium]|nr:3'(2'),5'-bisphosphate nucleotidase CysQ [Candidatus Zymogenaceae bacterium]